ncbi:VOC family protein [bacterium]|nr:VOC family protein [bacterium]
MDLRPRETVILAEDFTALVSWYRDALGFKVTRLFEDEYHYVNLESESGIQIGIASASEMGVEANDRSKNTVLMQYEVDDVKEFFEHLKSKGGKLTFGPSFDEKGGFWFGGVADPEGNPIWVVDKNCP